MVVVQVEIRQERKLRTESGSALIMHFYFLYSSCFDIWDLADPRDTAPPKAR